MINFLICLVIYCTVDCGIPSPSVNARIVRYSGTKVGDHLIMQCDEGFVPSAMMPAMCTNSGTWTPAPGSYKCTSMEGNCNSGNDTYIAMYLLLVP